jgi:hypothetical protein
MKGVVDAKILRDFIADRASGGGTAAWTVLKRVTLGVEVGWTTATAPKGAAMVVCNVRPNTPYCRFLGGAGAAELDLSQVSIYNIVCRHVKTTVGEATASPPRVLVRLNYYHKGVNELQKAEAHDNIIAAAGGVKGAFLAVGPGAEDKELDVVPLPSLSFGPTNEAFTQTMALVNEDNLMNGVHHVPRDVCVAAGLPVYRGAPEIKEETLTAMLSGMSIDQERAPAIKQALRAKWEERVEDSQKIDSFYAVPERHVLAWGAINGKVRAETVVPGYFLIADVYFKHFVKEFRSAWMNKVDTRPLGDVAFEFLTPLAGSAGSLPTTLSLRSYLTYVAPPQGLTRERVAKLVPMLSNGFFDKQQQQP